jgi:4-amino-4-deoxy-L-arabinose transferase-like glycosyltransferase
MGLDVLLIMTLALLTSCFLLGQGPLAGTEPHRALVADQMVHSGDWIVPRLLDQVYLAKPPLHYWILASMEKLTGRADTFIWRLPSAIGGALTAAILYLTTARWYGRLAGLVSGIGCCGLVALWGQNRTAEIDALNTTACIAGACLLLDMGFGPRRGRAWIFIGAALAMVAAMLLKGPAGLAPIAGALIGPAIFNRTIKHLKSVAPWACLLTGMLAFGAYSHLALVHIRALNLPPDTSGVAEVATNFLTERMNNLWHNLVMPAELFFYAMPVSLGLLLALHPVLWKKNPPNRSDGADLWTGQDRLLLRAILGTLAVSLAITMLFGLVHPRYSYVWLPLVCPIAGAVAAAWQRGVFQPRFNELVLGCLKITAIVISIGTGVIAFITAKRGGAPVVMLYFSAIASAVVAAGLWISIDRQRFARAGWAMVLLILLLSIPYSIMGVLDRNRRSILPVAQALAAMLPPGERVTTGNLVLNDPALFYYAKLQVESHPDPWNRPREFPSSRWVLLDQFEYPAWSASLGDRLRDVRRIDSFDGAIYLAWYVAR